MYLFIYLCIHLESTFVEIKPKKSNCHWLCLQTPKYGFS